MRILITFVVEMTFGDLNINLIPIDLKYPDVLTLENPFTFRELYFENEPTILSSVSSSIIQLQHIYGLIPIIHVKGNNSQKVFEMIKNYEKNNIYPSSTEIDELILFDRSIDLITPLCTQLTYGGLIDELLPNHIEDKKYMEGALFNELRDLNFSRIGSVLSNKLKSTC